MTGPDGDVELTRAQACWLSRQDAENWRRWLPPTEHPTISLSLMTSTLRARSKPPALPVAWLWLNWDTPVPPALVLAAETAGAVEPLPMRSTEAQLQNALTIHPSRPPEESSVAELEALVIRLRVERDAAIADAESMDIAMMAMRDNWKRRLAPHSVADLHER